MNPVTRPTFPTPQPAQGVAAAGQSTVHQPKGNWRAGMKMLTPAPNLAPDGQAQRIARDACPHMPALDVLIAAAVRELDAH